MNQNNFEINNGGGSQESPKISEDNIPQEQADDTCQQLEAGKAQQDDKLQDTCQFKNGQPQDAEHGDGLQKPLVKPRLSGAGKKRLAYLLKQGLSREEAYAKALLPIASGDKNTASIPKRVLSPDPTTSETYCKRPRDDQSLVPTIRMPVVPVAPVMAMTPVDKKPPTVSHKEDVTGVRVAILARDYPNAVLTTAQMDSIQDMIMDKVIEEKDKPTKPAFLNSIYKTGYLVLNCKDNKTAEWLKATILKATMWEGASLWTTEESKIPSSRVAVGYFPFAKQYETVKILDCIQGQNEGLNIPLWRALRRLERGPHVALVLAIDQKSAATLLDTNGKINFRFGQVILRLKPANTNDDELVSQVE